MSKIPVSMFHVYVVSWWDNTQGKTHAVVFTTEEGAEEWIASREWEKEPDICQSLIHGDEKI